MKEASKLISFRDQPLAVGCSIIISFRKQQTLMLLNPISNRFHMNVFMFPRNKVIPLQIVPHRTVQKSIDKRDQISRRRHWVLTKMDSGGTNKLVSKSLQEPIHH